MPLENSMAAVSSSGLMFRSDMAGSGVLAGLVTKEENAVQPGWSSVDIMT